MSKIRVKSTDLRVKVVSLSVRNVNRDIIWMMFFCRNCRSKCSTCTDDSDNCECAEGYAKKLNSSTCEVCTPQPLCASGESTLPCISKESNVFLTCLRCDLLDYYILNGTCTSCLPQEECRDASTILGCKGDTLICDSCIDGYYVDDGICTECSDNCKQCSSTQCNLCNEGYRLAFGACIECTDCEPGQYIETPCNGSSVNRVCTNCNYGPSYSCTSGKTRNGTECSGSGTVDTQTCDDCTANCLRCTDSECEACDQPFYLSEGICKDCSAQPNCATPGGQCVKMGDGYFTTCIGCDVGYRLTPNGICESVNPCLVQNTCEEHCEHTGPDTHNCFCSSAHTVVNTTTGACECVPGYYKKDGACVDLCSMINPCGPYSTCTVSGNQRLCKCLPDYRFGDSRVPFVANVTVSSTDPWNSENDCKAFDYCTGIETDSAPFFGCGTYDAKPVPCTSVRGGRICTCPPGYELEPEFQSLSFIPPSEDVYGCNELNECDFSKRPLNSSHIVSCYNQMNSRKIKCGEGYWARGPNQVPPNPFITLVGDEYFEGCDVINTCEVYSSGLEHANCVSSLNKRTIACHTGYHIGVNVTTIEITGNTAFGGCKAINLCEQDNGGCEGSCTYVSPGNRSCSCGSHASRASDQKTCICDVGYQKVGYGICEDTNECFSAPGGCGPYSICSTPQLNKRTCQCLSGYHFPGLSTSDVIVIDGVAAWNASNDCIAHNVCNTTLGSGYGCGSYTGVECVAAVGSRTCRCPEGSFVVGGSGRSVLLKIGTVFGGCQANDYCNPMANGGSGGYGCGSGSDVECAATPQGRTCTCPHGYNVKDYSSGSRMIPAGEPFPGCEVIDQCTMNPCGQFSECRSQLGYRICTCMRGYHFRSLNNTEGISSELLTGSMTLQQGEAWNPVNECTVNDNCNHFFDNPPSGKFGCGNGDSTVESCVDTIGGRKCKCAAGHYIPGIGESASLPDTVVFSGCTLSDTCDYYFDSNLGFRGCSIELFNEMPVTCIPNVTKRTCVCPPGFYVTGKRTNSVELTIGETFDGCTDIDECDTVNPCGENSECTQQILSRFCKCRNGFHIASQGSEKFSVFDIETRGITIEGTTRWRSEDECVVNDNCNVNFDSPSTGGYGCGVHTYGEQVVDCQNSILGRTCTCPPGFYILGNDTESLFFTAGEQFSGCYDIDECELYGAGDHATCVNSGINQRTVTCDPGFFVVTRSEDVSITLIGNERFPGCLDFNECNFGCADQVVTVACSESTSDNTILPNTRVCTCPSGYSPFGNPEITSHTLEGSEFFMGCIDCTPCPFNSYLLEPCNSTHGRTCATCEPCLKGSWTSVQCTEVVPTGCTRCSTCEEGYYIASPCNTQNDTLCLPCSPPCELPTYEAISCSNGLNRVCATIRAPECAGGCGPGICVNTDVCECPLGKGYYGKNCELNCHMTCLKYSATCEISLPGQTWWCECAPGWFPNIDNQKCFPTEDKNTPNCPWGEWSEWSSCSGCGSTKKREAELIGDEYDASCSRVYPQREICSSSCAILYEDQAYVASRTKLESGAYHTLSLAKFWEKNVAKFISAKYNISVVLSQDVQVDAFNEVFRLFFLDPAQYIPLLLSSDNSTKRDAGSEDEDLLDMCMFGDRLDDAVTDVIEITQQYMESTLLTPLDDVQWGLENGCELVYKVNSPPELVIWPIFGGVVGGMAVVLLVLCLIFIWYKNRPLDVSGLPSKVRWQYEQYLSNPSGWVKNKGQSFFKKELSPASEEFEKMEDFFYNILEASRKIEIKEAYAIFNPVLVQSFINYRNIITSRMVDNPEIFAKQDWASITSKDKDAVFDKYLARCIKAGWNAVLDVPILLTCHVTDFNVATAIASTGFAGLSSLDVGWHGAGVYFTTYAMYACRFFENRADPALLISFVTLGNVYPVTESHTGPTSLMGQRLKPGYTAHYAAIGEDGAVPDRWDDPDSLYDELVVSQEPQIAPVYLIRLSNDSLADVFGEKKTVSFAPAQ
eukprot:TRINITY_DN1616_c0_g1_i2.p2 TRINITY_DN1616_c0_g1~~TRINITY_DN1616_c0_g1_i2.p2  ORF type:complete len:1987 (-),score=299.68 TRINITY_DN1616_c0_g1_i2:6-5966(-)